MKTTSSHLSFKDALFRIASASFMLVLFCLSAAENSYAQQQSPLPPKSKAVSIELDDFFAAKSKAHTILNTTPFQTTGSITVISNEKEHESALETTVMQKLNANEYKATVKNSITGGAEKTITIIVKNGIRYTKNGNGPKAPWAKSKVAVLSVADAEKALDGRLEKMREEAERSQLFSMGKTVYNGQKTIIFYQEVDSASSYFSGRFHPASRTVYFWIDEQGRILREVQTDSVKNMDVTVTTEFYYDYKVPIKISADNLR